MDDGLPVRGGLSFIPCCCCAFALCRCRNPYHWVTVRGHAVQACSPEHQPHHTAWLCAYTSLMGESMLLTTAYLKWTRGTPAVACTRVCGQLSQVRVLWKMIWVKRIGLKIKETDQNGYLNRQFISACKGTEGFTNGPGLESSTENRSVSSTVYK